MEFTNPHLSELCELDKKSLDEARIEIIYFGQRNSECEVINGDISFRSMYWVLGNFINIMLLMN